MNRVIAETAMGDQVGIAVGGTLHYVPFNEFKRILGLGISPIEKTCLFANLCRINTLYMIARAGSGHIGSSFSSLDIMSWLQLNEIIPSQKKDGGRADLFFSSKGHDAPALYNTLIGLGRIEFDLIHKLRKLGGLPGHPDINTPNIVTNTGSLGMGVSKAKGMIAGDRLQNRSRNIYVLTGDGELQEGQFWESLVSAANHKMHELTVIVDHNKLQSDTMVSMVSNLGDLEAKLLAFGWHVSRCDGNNIKEFAKIIADTREVHDRPKVIIADTIKGKGVSFMEHTSIDSDVELYKFHSGAPSSKMYAAALQELVDIVNKGLFDSGNKNVELQNVDRPVAISIGKSQRLIQAYSDALLKKAYEDLRIVALDADLIVDTGLIPFKEKFPERFIECGIAEQDMVSQAGGLALNGFLPVVHSFGCFLSSRPNEQIYNNATERTKIVYVGSLAGVLPAGPGHSHQSVRDISALGAVPGLIILEPCNEEETTVAVDFCINGTSHSTYLRLTSIPCEIPYILPKNYKMELGKGVSLRAGGDAVLFGYGPVLLAEAYKAANMLEEKNIDLKIINLPWLNFVDVEWLEEVLSGYNYVFTLDNHYSVGGQGDLLLSKIAEMGLCGEIVTRKFGLTQIPECGSNDEVLQVHGLDANHLCKTIEASMMNSTSKIQDS